MKRCLRIGLPWTLVLFGLINWIDFARRPVCFDCAFPRGVPFRMYHDPTFNSMNGIGDIIWVGAIANVVFAMTSGMLLAWLIHATSKSSSPL